MQLNKVNYALVVYLALVEGLSLLVLDLLKPFPIDAFLGLIVGFVPALIVLAVYRLSSSQMPIKLNGKEVTKLPIFYPSIINAIFIEVLFFVQRFIPSPSNILGEAVLGLLSVLIASLLLIMAYNMFNLKLKFELSDKSLKLTHIDLTTSVYAGILEFFILPLMFMFYLINIHPLLNGLVAGFVGSLIGLWIVNRMLERRPLELLL